jgi:hypothetical protein
MSATDRAADDARAEADRLWAEAAPAMVLEDESPALYDAATDAIEAARRAEGRARQLERLADHDAGVYNAFEGSEDGPP